MGNCSGAESDIRMGAELEVSGAGTYDIGKALERVQGPERLRFESIRRYAQIDAMRARANRVPVAPTFESPPMIDDATRMPPAATDPFRGDEEVEEVLDVPDTEQPPAVDALDDGLGSDMGDDFLDEPAEGMAEPPVEDADPFGDESDPFGDDPFGDAPSGGPADAAPATPPPAEVEEADPFGDDADPFGAADDDPFGSTETPLPDLDSLFNE